MSHFSAVRFVSWVLVDVHGSFVGDPGLTSVSRKSLEP